MLHSPSTRADSDEEVLSPSTNDDVSSHSFNAATHREGFTSLSLFRLCMSGFLFSLPALYSYMPPPHFSLFTTVIIVINLSCLRTTYKQ